MAYIEIHDQPGEHRDYFTLEGVAVVDFGDEYAVWHAPFRADIRYIAIIIGEGGIGASAVNYTQILTRDRGTAGTLVGLLETRSFNAAAVEFNAYYVYEPATYYAVASGTVISLQYVAQALGEAMPRMEGYVVYEGR